MPPQHWGPVHWRPPVPGARQGSAALLLADRRVAVALGGRLAGEPLAVGIGGAEALALGVELVVGEAWHHNHHTFPRSARHGLSKVETSLDPSAWLIAVMERLGLVWDVVRITPERQGQKLAAEA